MRILLVAALALPSVTAQTAIHSALSGRVLDPSGAGVGQAQVEATHTASGSRTATTSSSEGAFTFPRLIPGSYRITAEKTGFRRFEQEGLELAVNQAASTTIALTVGDVNTTVTVRADAAVVQSQTAEVSLLVDGRGIRNLPLNGKDFQKLIFLAPGMSNFRANNPNSNASSSGTRESANNYVMDGVSLNDERETAGLALGASFRQQPNVISTEALQEFRVITSNADASFGRGSGAQVNAVTRSGSNEWHGSAYEYLRNSALDARDFFNYGPYFDSSGRAKTPPFRQNLFGGTLGGPIRRNRHFFFANYEGFRQRLEQTGSPVLPTADLVNLFPGELGRLARAYYFDRDLVPRSGLPAGAIARPFPAAERNAAIAAGFPSPLFDGDLATGEAATAQVSRSSTRDFRQNAFLVRTDHRLGEKLTLSFRYAQADYRFDTTNFGLPGTNVRTPGEFRSPTLQAVWILSPRQTVEIRGAYLRRSTNNIMRDDFSELGIGEFGVALSATGTAGFSLPQLAPFSILDAQSTPQVAGQYSWTTGKATIRAGFDVRGIAVNFINRSFPRPAYQFNGLVGPNGLLGSSPASAEATAAVATVTVFGANGGPATPLRGWRSQQQEYFVQADWRLRRDLTLNGGLRYSYFGVYGESNNALSNLYATRDGRIVDNVSPFAFGRAANEMAPIGPDRPFYNPDFNNFQPRVGFAWNIGGRDSRVLRGAFGMYNDRLYQLVISEVARNVPFAVTGNAINVPFRPRDPIPLNPRVPVVFAVNPELRNPTVYRWNISFEQRLGQSTSVNAAYVGAKGRGLLLTEDPNFAGAYPQGQRPDPRFSDQRILGNGGHSDYHALQIHGRRRMAGGVAFSAAYTYSRYRDITSTDTIFGVVPTVINTGASAAPGFQTGRTIPRPLDSEYGISENDAPHILAASYAWELPLFKNRALLGGWSVSGLASIRSGNTFDVTLGQDVNDDGAFNDRPALLGRSLSELYSGSGADRTQWLLPQAQARTLLGVPADVTDPFAPVSRGAFRGPSFVSFDVSLMKRFAIGERAVLHFDANVFNVFNRANFRPPQSNLSSAFFGQISGSALAATPRQIQFGLKLQF